MTKSSTGTKKPLVGGEAPFVLSEALPKLVWHILREEYVDMAELLKDNVKAERRLAAEGGMAPMLTAVVVPAHPGKTKELLAYQALVVSEAVYSGPLPLSHVIL